MMDNGIGMDMVSLSRPPLHTAPLFISKRRVPIEMGFVTPHEAVTAAMARAKEHEPTFSRQYGMDSPLAVGGAGTGGIGAGFRRLSSNSEEAFLQEQPKYEASAMRLGRWGWKEGSPNAFEGFEEEEGCGERQGESTFMFPPRLG